MSTIRYLPPVCAAISTWRVLSGRVSFPKDRLGKTLAFEDDGVHSVFREMQVSSPQPCPSKYMTVLKVSFKFARFSPTVNKWLSLIPVPVILGMPGFRHKTWTSSGDSGYSQGIYQFESMDLAVGYRESLIMRVLKKRSVPGSTSYEIFPGTSIEEYLESKSQQLQATGGQQQD